MLICISCSRLLDLLLDVNNSEQIPEERRFDLGLDPSDPRIPRLEIDVPFSHREEPQVGKSLRRLIREVPHLDFAAAGERFPELVADLKAGRDTPADRAFQRQSHPPTFLTADDIDNYIWEIDERLANDARSAATAAAKHRNGASPSPSPRPMSPLPTLAPLALLNGGHTVSAGPNTGLGSGSTALRDAAQASRDFALRNPTSVYNWLRKHAPKTFLQDGEAAADKEKLENGNDDHPHEKGHARGGGRKGGERGGGRGGAGTTRAKRLSAAHARDRTAAAAESMEHLDDEIGLEAGHSGAGGGGGAEKAAGAGKGKRKRAADNDLGYRPKGGSSRPLKKKRKSEGDSTPTSAAAPKRGAASRKASAGGPRPRRATAEKVEKIAIGEEAESDEGRED